MFRFRATIVVLWELVLHVPLRCHRCNAPARSARGSGCAILRSTNRLPGMVQRLGPRLPWQECSRPGVGPPLLGSIVPKSGPGQQRSEFEGLLLAVPGFGNRPAARNRLHRRFPGFRNPNHTANGHAVGCTSRFARLRTVARQTATPPWRISGRLTHALSASCGIGHADFPLVNAFNRFLLIPVKRQTRSRPDPGGHRSLVARLR